MATLELGIDARPMVQGAQQAQQALDGVAKAAQKTTTEVEKTTKAAADAGKAVSQSGAAMRAAFQATGGSIQVAGGIAEAELPTAVEAGGEGRVAAAVDEQVAAQPEPASWGTDHVVVPLTPHQQLGLPAPAGTDTAWSKESPRQALSSAGHEERNPCTPSC